MSPAASTVRVSPAASTVEDDAEVTSPGTIPSPDRPPVEVFGIRHHGPGSARSLVAALEDYDPEAILIEGPADADPLIAWTAAAEMEPPVALLAYAADQPSVAAFWPFAVFSPEWQAMTWGLARELPVSFCDLPAAITLAEHDQKRGAKKHDQLREDPLAQLAAAAGYDDAERWWDDVIESRVDAVSPFPALTEAMAELRDDRALRQAQGTSGQAGGTSGQGQGASGQEPSEEERREAYMRRTIRAAMKQGYQRIAVVCGAWHAPALTLPLPPATADARVLRGIPKQKVTITWVPWTHERLTAASGYGAGIASPGWYHHLWTAPDRPVVRWLTEVARALRSRDLPVSSAHVIEAVRLAEGLAVLRGRPLAGLSEVTEATRAVLCDGDEVAVRFVTDRLVVGQALGSVSPDVPMVPLEADLLAQCRSLRLKRTAEPLDLDLDLRKPRDQLKSRLLHRLRLLGLDWAWPGESGVENRGTFRESWELEWRPELAVDLVEAAVWGTTVEAAAQAKVAHLVATQNLAELTATVESCLLADLPGALAALLRALEEQAALDADLEHLMDALPALVRAQRYGDVRATDTAALGRVARALLVRIRAGLPQALAGLDDAAATTMRRRIDAVHGAVQLGAGREEREGGPGREAWLSTLRRMIDRPDLNGELVGRLVRILTDAERLDDAPVRLHRALSRGVPAPAKAAWVDGFFSDGALLLIHDAELLTLLDDWVRDLSEEEFVDALPLVRRTFSSFAEPERRAIMGRIAAGRTSARTPPAEKGLDLERGAAAFATVAAILGARP